MKKQLIAGSAALALASPLAVMADSGPTVYGFVNLSVDYENYEHATDSSQDGDLAMNTGSSHFGARGSESLDGGLSAIYQFEAEWAYTGDAQGSPGDEGPITQIRDSFVGLEGDFGQVTIGRRSTGNQFVYDGPGADWAAQVGTPGGALSHGLGSRSNNAIRYVGPGFGPLNVEATVATSVGEEPGDHLLGLRGTFSDGPLSAAATVYDISSAESGDFGNTGDDGDGVTIYSLGGRYDLGMATVSAQFSGKSADADDADDNSLSLGAMMPMGDTGRVKAIVTQFNADADDSDYTTYAVGYDHIFSDRTELRFAVAATNNDDNTNNTPHAYGIYGPSSVEGGDLANDETHSTVSVNLRHSF